MAYSHLLFKSIHAKVEARKHEIQTKMSDLIPLNFDIARDFFVKFAEKEIIALTFPGKNVELYTGKIITEKDFEYRSDMIIEQYKRLFDKIVAHTKTQNLNINFIRFLAFISEDQGVLPSDFMFDFELKRLQFTHFATLKNMGEITSKMVIGCFVLLRVLLHKIIMRPWECFSKVSEKTVKKKTLISVGSLLYLVVTDFFRNTAPLQKNNQSFLPPQLKVRARQIPLQAIDVNPNDEDDGSKKKNTNSKEPELISGFLTKENIPFFYSKKGKYDAMKKIIDGWLEQMYRLTHELYTNTKKEDRETLGIPK